MICKRFEETSNNINIYIHVQIDFIIIHYLHFDMEQNPRPSKSQHDRLICVQFLGEAATEAQQLQSEESLQSLHLKNGQTWHCNASYYWQYIYGTTVTTAWIDYPEQTEKIQEYSRKIKNHNTTNRSNILKNDMQKFLWMSCLDMGLYDTHTTQINIFWVDQDYAFYSKEMFSYQFTGSIYNI